MSEPEAEKKRGEKKRGPSLIGLTIKGTLVVVGLSWFAASWLSQSDKQGLASLIARATDDGPATTASIGARAAKTRIDPCVAPPRR